jgi:hypothetical protein
MAVLNLKIIRLMKKISSSRFISLFVLQLALSFMFLTSLKSQNSGWIWGRNAIGGGNNEGYCITNDAFGNVYVTGYFYYNSITFGGYTLNNIHSSGSDVFLVKYNANGDVLWAKNIGGNFDDYGKSICTDINGNVYVTGNFRSDSLVFDSDTLINTSTGLVDIFLAKYDSNGNFIWAKSFGGNSTDQSSSITIDENSNLYMTGYFYSDTLVFGNDTLYNGGYSTFIVKYDSNGYIFWAKCSKSASAYSIIADNNGHIYITGDFAGSYVIFENDTLFNSSGSNYDFFLVKYDSIGNVLWAKSEGGSGHEVGNSVTTDGLGNIIITGEFSSDSITFDSYLLNNFGLNDIFIVKYNSIGNVLGATTAGGIKDDYSNHISSDAFGSFYLTGYFESDTLVIDGTTLVNNGIDNIFLAKFNSNCNIIWARSVEGNLYDYSNSITNDSIGNVYITGSFNSSSIVFENDTLINNGHPNFFISKLGYATSINELNNVIESIIFPNPSSQVLNIKTIPNSEIYIYNIEGKLVKSAFANCNLTIINISFLSKGIYLIKVKTDKGITINKFIKS